MGAGRRLFLKRWPLSSLLPLFSTESRALIPGQNCMDYTKFHVHNSIQLGLVCIDFDSVVEESVDEKEDIRI